jgi:putative hydrolase of the HAD superfamily
VITAVGFDADDTLWHSEHEFVISQDLFTELLRPYAPPDIDLEGVLATTERRNLALFGFGVKGFTLSMIETAIEVTEGAVPVTVLAQLLERGKAMIQHPVELLDGVLDVLDALAGRYELLLITKGDLIHQESKVAASGLAERFNGIEVVADKDEATYQRILDRHGIAPGEFVMVGNSVRSDVLPVIAIGGRAVHVPYVVTWIHEHVEHDETIPVLSSLRGLPKWLADHDDALPAWIDQ